MVSDQLPVVEPKLAAVPLAISVVPQTRPRVCCGPDLLLPVCADVSDIEPDVCDVPDEFPVSMETAAMESLCFTVVVQTRPQGGCDPVLPLPVCKGQDFLAEGGPDVIVFRRESIIT